MVWPSLVKSEESRRPRNTKPALGGGSHAGRSRGKSILADGYSPKSRPLVKLKVVTFGNEIGWPGDWQHCQSAILTACATPLRRVSDPRGELCLLNNSGAPWR